MEDASTFQLMCELGNTLRKHNQLELAVQLYKKSLLSLKQRFKNTYLQQRDTSRMIINIASTEFMRNNISEALRYYEHAIVVLNQTSVGVADISKWIELAKVHVSVGHIYRQFNDKIGAFQQF